MSLEAEPLLRNRIVSKLRPLADGHFALHGAAGVEDDRCALASRAACPALPSCCLRAGLEDLGLEDIVLPLAHRTTPLSDPSDDAPRALRRAMSHFA